MDVFVSDIAEEGEGPRVVKVTTSLSVANVSDPYDSSKVLSKDLVKGTQAVQRQREEGLKRVLAGFELIHIEGDVVSSRLGDLVLSHATRAEALASAVGADP